MLRSLLLIASVLFLSANGKAISTATISPSSINTLPTDTVAPLTRSELRELRQLERADARARRRAGLPTSRSTDARRALPLDVEGANPLAIAALPSGIAGVAAFFIAIGLWSPGPLIALSVAAFVCAVVFGAIGLRRARRFGYRHRGLAIAGLVLGLIGSAFYGFILALIMGSPGF